MKKKITILLVIVVLALSMVVPAIAANDVTTTVNVGQVTGWSVSTVPITLNIDPTVNKSSSQNIDISVQTNASSYNVLVQEDKQPTNGTTPLPYISGGAGQASGFITHGGTTKGYGYTMAGTGAIPVGFSAGAKYASFNTVGETIMSGGLTNGDTGTLTVAAYADYTMKSGSYTNQITFTIVPTY